MRISMTAIAFLLLAVLATAEASAETRKLKLHFLHTGEKAEIAFKKNGRYINSGLQKINRFLRDWRRNEPTKMDPRLLDLIWEVYQDTGSRNYINVVSGYRSPATNSLLRKRGRGVAKKSQHTLGKALDFFIPGVNLRKLRDIGLKKGLGGVGYYPKSGSPFVHMDTGRVRHWPRMSRQELVKVFPKGNTLHVPTDGKPLARYNQAKAEYERKLKGGFSVASAKEVEKKPGFFASLLGRDEGDDEENGVTAKPSAVIAALNTDRPNTRREPSTERKITPVAPKPEPEVAAQPAKPEVPAAAPTPAAEIPAPVPVQPVEAPEPEVVTPEEEPTPEAVIAALAGNAIPVPQVSPRVLALNQTTAIAQAESTATETLEIAGTTAVEESSLQLAYGVPVRAPREDGPAANPLAAIAALETRPEVSAQDTIAADTSGVQSASLAVEASETNLPAVAPVEITRTPTSRKDALTADEIEDLRHQVYASLKKELKRNQIDTTSTLASTSRAAVSGDLENLPVPVQAQRKLANASADKAPASSVETVNKDGTVTVKIDENRLGNWAFQPAVPLEQIKQITPPAYIRNVLQGRPASSPSSGFVVRDGEQDTTSALGNVNFKRFQ